MAQATLKRPHIVFTFGFLCAAAMASTDVHSKTSMIALSWHFIACATSSQDSQDSSVRSESTRAIGC